MSSSIPLAQMATPSVEANLALPEYAQDLLPELELPRLVLISHRHSPPLIPAPQLRFDVRSLPNPPKHIRDAHNGTSKRLQEWMQTDQRFIIRRDEIASQIEAAMTTMGTAHEMKDTLKLGPQYDEERSGARGHSVGASEELEAKERNNDASEDEEEYSSSQESQDDHTTASRDDETTLRVGIFCAMGRHRSVAIVEGLAKLSWPGWRVEVEHRDISKKHGAGKKFGGQSHRGSRGGAMSIDEQSE
jgi:RNase adaptor protein for sRNA GlmZ degradation